VSKCNNLGFNPVSKPHSILLGQLAQRADAIERSWSLTAGGMERRLLFFFSSSEANIGALTSAARRLDLEPALINAWLEALPAADAIGLAVRDDLRSVRLYTQYWDVLVSRVRAGQDEPAPLYAGFKSLHDGSTRIDAYICWPGAPREEFMPEIETTLVTRGADADEVARAFEPLTAECCIFTRTRTNGRRSWLATVRRAELSRSDIARVLGPVLSQAEGGHEIARAAASRDMVHIAGGEDDSKGRFLTLYFEARPEELNEFLSPAAG
jgi:hypothetical protein